MSWIGILSALLTVAVKLVTYLQEKNQMDAASALALKELLNACITQVELARAARSAVIDTDAASMQHDPFNRDNSPNPPEAS